MRFITSMSGILTSRINLDGFISARGKVSRNEGQPFPYQHEKSWKFG